MGDSHEFAQEAHFAVLLSLYEGHLVALHGFIKKTSTTPPNDLRMARLRKEELEK